MDDAFKAQLEDLKKVARRADKEDRERAEAFVAMEKMEGWPLYISLLNIRLQALSERLLAPSGSIDGVLTSEFIKGAMYGLVLARDLPSITIESMRQISASTDEEDNVE